MVSARERVHELDYSIAAGNGGRSRRLPRPRHRTVLRHPIRLRSSAFGKGDGLIASRTTKRRIATPTRTAAPRTAIGRPTKALWSAISSIATPPPGAPVNDLAIFSYSPVTKTFTRVGIFKEAKPFLNEVTVQENTWITSAEIPYKGKTLIYRDVYVFPPGGKQRTTTVQISADKGQTWTTVSQFTAVQVKS